MPNIEKQMDEMIQTIYSDVRREVYESDATGTITPEEAAKLCSYQPLSDYFLGKKIYKALCKEHNLPDYALGLLFLAGKIAGIRQERKRRAAKLDESHSNKNAA